MNFPLELLEHPEDTSLNLPLHFKNNYQNSLISLNGSDTIKRENTLVNIVKFLTSDVHFQNMILFDPISSTIPPQLETLFEPRNVYKGLSVEEENEIIRPSMQYNSSNENTMIRHFLLT